jgi:hypothetical protein
MAIHHIDVSHVLANETAELGRHVLHSLAVIAQDPGRILFEIFDLGYALVLFVVLKYLLNMRIVKAIFFALEDMILHEVC